MHTSRSITGVRAASGGLCPENMQKPLFLTWTSMTVLGSIATQLLKRDGRIPTALYYRAVMSFVRTLLSVVATSPSTISFAVESVLA